MTKLERAREILMAIVTCTLVAVFYGLLDNAMASITSTILAAAYMLSHLNEALLAKIDDMLKVFIE